MTASGKCGPRADWLFTSAEVLVSEVAPIASNSPKYSETVFLPQQESLPAEGGKSEEIKWGHYNQAAKILKSSRLRHEETILHLL